VDVEQIMREIRAKIAQRHGIDLTDQQVQELAARRLESILDLRSIKPGLLDQLRRSAGARPDTVAAADRATPAYEFEDTTLYDSPSGFTRFMRKLLNPILKLFFNPNPLIRALHLQSRLNTDLAKREAERDLRQAEWNALHFEILQRVVSEASRATLELQSLSLRVESLAGKVDFNERRVRGIEGVVHQARPGGGREREGRERERDRDVVRERDVVLPPPASQPSAAEVPQAPRESASPETAGTAEAPRRRRRRRRGRRGGGAVDAALSGAPAAAAAIDTVEGDDLDEGGPDEMEPGEPSPPELEAAVAPERVTPQLESLDPSARENAAPDVPEPAPTLPEPEPHEPQ
jgi:hypothetical protein